MKNKNNDWKGELLDNRFYIPVSYGAETVRPVIDVGIAIKVIERQIEKESNKRIIGVLNELMERSEVDGMVSPDDLIEEVQNKIKELEGENEK